MKRNVFRPDDVGEYESLLINEDRFDQFIRIGVLLVPVGMSFFFRVGQIYVWAAGLVAFRLIYDLIAGFGMNRWGYRARGASALRGLMWWLAMLMLYGALYWIQSRYHLWFSQDRLCGRSC